MVKPTSFRDEHSRKAIAQIAQLLEELVQQVTDANMKLDHIIETYHNDRYAFAQSGLYDPLNGYDTQ